MLPSLVDSTDVVGTSLVLGALVSVAAVDVTVSVDPVVFSSDIVVATKYVFIKYNLLNHI